MKNAKRVSKKESQSIQQTRARALRALGDSALKAAKGGIGGDPPPPPSSDPIC